MKTSFTTLIILFFVLSAFGQNQPPVAVNDTIYGTIGNTVYITRSFLLQNDYDPDGDSIRIMNIEGFTRINDTTWKKSLTNVSDWIIYCPYNIKDQFFYSSPSGVITLYVNGGVRPDSIDVNNINARLNPAGQHFWDFETAHFEVPKGSGKHSIFSHSIWIGGIKDGDTLCTVKDSYYRNEADFAAGPISTSLDSSFYIKWNRVWKISKNQIQYHINNYNQSGYNPIDPIANWPANGDVAYGQLLNIAPFYDKNTNGIYEPILGDYPLIRGDEAVFFVFNDANNNNSDTTWQQIGVEIHGMAYGYNRPDDSTLNNTIFMHYDIINRSAYNYHDNYLGLFADFDLGYHGDDYIASDVTNGMMYVYNGTPVDGTGQSYAYGEHPPAIGLKVIGGPYLEPDGIDNLQGECGYSLNGLNFGDGIMDNERMGMTYFMNMNDPALSALPFVSTTYYNSMQNIWQDGTHIIYGGNGHPTVGGLGPDCNFMFPGNSDTVCNYGTNGIMPNGGLNQNGNYWTEAATGNTPDDRRGVASVGPFNFDAGETIPLDYCFTWARDYNGDNNSSAELLRERIAALAPSWNTLINAPETYFGVPESEKGSLLAVYPNPVKDKATVTVEGPSQIAYMLFSINGAFIKQGILNPGKNLLDLTNLKSGVYILKSGSRNVRIVKM